MLYYTSKTPYQTWTDDVFRWCRTRVVRRCADCRRSRHSYLPRTTSSCYSEQSTSYSVCLFIHRITTTVSGQRARTTEWSVPLHGASHPPPVPESPRHQRSTPLAVRRRHRKYFCRWRQVRQPCWTSDLGQRAISERKLTGARRRRHWPGSSWC